MAATSTIVAITDASVLTALKEVGAEISADALAKRMVGPSGKASTVNPSLYRLKRSKKVSSQGEKPPLWSATEKILSVDDVYYKWSNKILTYAASAAHAVNIDQLSKHLGVKDTQILVLMKVIERMVHDGFVTINIGITEPSSSQITYVITHKGGAQVAKLDVIKTLVKAAVQDASRDGGSIATVDIATIIDSTSDLAEGVDPKQLKSQINSHLYTMLRKGEVARTREKGREKGSEVRWSIPS